MYKLAVFTNFPLLPTPGYRVFFDRLMNSNRIELIDVNNPLSANMSISINHQDNQLAEIISAGIPKQNRHLIMLECRQILPNMHSNDTLKEYGHIYSPSPFWAVEFNPILFKYGFNLEVPGPPKPLVDRKYTFGLVQRNKYSCVKGELYTLRREVVFKMSKIGIDLELRGPDWNRSTSRAYFDYLKILRFGFINFRDTEFVIIPKYLRIKNRFISSKVKNKQDFLQSVKVAIIIENGIDYVSEKIFDCFRAGTVPIYVGPELEQFGIPENTVIRANPNSTDVLRVIENIDNYDLQEVQNNGWKFLNSGGQDWAEVNVMKSLAERILNEI
jgi:hypothetical protein